jgi:hypothetical protein
MTGTEPHALRRTAGSGIGPNRDRWPCADHGVTNELQRAQGPGSCTKRRRQPWAQPGPRNARRRCYASTHAHLGTAGRGTRWDLWAVSGLEALRDSEWSRGCRCDAVAVTFFQYRAFKRPYRNSLTHTWSSSMLNTWLFQRTPPP